MALNLPNLNKLTPGRATGAGIRAAGTGAPRALFGGSKALIPKPKAPQHQVSPYDQFTLPDPYKAGQIGSLAQSGWQSDVDNANKLAQMGQPTTQQITTDYAGRGAAANSVQQDLAARLANIQQATVAQGNAGSAGLAQQNAAAQSSGGNIAGAPAAPGIPTNAATAVLGSQTAAAGNYGGALQAAALSSGAQANQRALDAGTVASTNANNDTQRALASLLSGVAPVSSRVATMTGENQKVDAANIQTKFSVYKDLVTQQQFAQASGDKRAIAAADNALKQWTVQQSNATKVKLGLAANDTKVKLGLAADATKTGIAAGNNATSTANNQRNNQTRTNIAKGKTAATAAGATNPTTGKPIKSYKVVYDVPVPGKDPVTGLGGNDPKTGKPYPPTFKRTTKNVPAAVWDRFNKSGPVGKRKFSIIGIPEGSKFKSSTGY